MIWRILWLLVLMLAVYPLSLALQTGIDWYWGDGELMRELAFGGKRRLLWTVFGDWQQSLLWAALAMLTGVLVLALLVRISQWLAWLLLAALLLAGAVLGLPLPVVMLGVSAYLLLVLWRLTTARAARVGGQS